MKKIKIWYLIIIFICWLLSMLLPATVNQKLLGTTFRVEKSRENFYDLLIHQIPAQTIIFLILTILAVILMARKLKFSSDLTFATLILYAFVFLFDIPTTNFGNIVEFFSAYWQFHMMSYFLTVLLGLIFYLGLYFYSKKEL